MSHDTTPTTIRLHDGILDRVDALVDLLGEDAELSKADVLRVAIVRGLVQLEAEKDAREKRCLAFSVMHGPCVFLRGHLQRSHMSPTGGEWP